MPDPPTGPLYHLFSHFEKGFIGGPGNQLVLLPSCPLKWKSFAGRLAMTVEKRVLCPAHWTALYGTKEWGCEVLSTHVYRRCLNPNKILQTKHVVKSILWMDKVLHHFETMTNHCLLVFNYRGIIILGFRGWCRSESIHSI